MIVNVGLINYAFCLATLWYGTKFFIATVAGINLRFNRFVVWIFIIMHISVGIQIRHTDITTERHHRDFFIHRARSFALRYSLKSILNEKFNPKVSIKRAFSENVLNFLKKAGEIPPLSPACCVPGMYIYLVILLPNVDSKKIHLRLKQCFTVNTLFFSFR